MDFVSIDDAKTHELLSQIRQNQNGGGWGLYRVIGSYESSDFVRSDASWRRLSDHIAVYEQGPGQRGGVQRR